MNKPLIFEAQIGYETDDSTFAVVEPINLPNNVFGVTELAAKHFGFEIPNHLGSTWYAPGRYRVTIEQLG